MRRVVSAALFIALGLFAGSVERPAASPAGDKPAELKVKLVDLAIVGGYAENITYVSGGRFEGLVAMAVGSEVLGVSPDGVKREPRKLFDFHAAGPRFRPTGLVYVPDWDRFVANDSDAMTRRWPEYFYVFDSKGKMERRPVVRGPGIATTAYSEGLAYVPADAAAWPADLRGRFLMVGYTDLDGTLPRVDVIEAGAGVFTVTRQIRLPTSLPFDPAWGSLAVLPDGELLLSAYGDCRFHRADASSFAALPAGTPMTLVQEPIAGCTNWTGGEGLIALPDSRVVATALIDDLAVFPAVSSGGIWTQTATIEMDYGLGLFTPDGLAWDDTRQQFLLKSIVAPTDGSRGNGVFSVNESLSELGLMRVLSNAPITERNFFGLAYRGDSDLVVTGRLGRALADFPESYPPSWADTRTPALMTGSLADRAAALVKIDVTAALGRVSNWQPPIYNRLAYNSGPTSVGFLADEQTYAVRMGADGRRVHILNQNGTWNRTLPVTVSCTDPAMSFSYTALASLPASDLGARFLVTGACSRAASNPPVPEDQGPSLLVFLDENGGEVFQFEATELQEAFSPIRVTAVTSGKHAGSFAVVDRNSKLAVFRVF